jgi:hypothetical protein
MLGIRQPHERGLGRAQIVSDGAEIDVIQHVGCARTGPDQTVVRRRT